MHGYTSRTPILQDNGEWTFEESFLPFWSLDPQQVAVVLLVCKGLLTLQEGINVTGLPADHLINEAQAWAVAEANVQA